MVKIRDWFSKFQEKNTCVVLVLLCLHGVPGSGIMVSSLQGGKMGVEPAVSDAQQNYMCKFPTSEKGLKAA